MKIFLKVNAATIFILSAILWFTADYLFKSVRTQPDEGLLKIVCFLIRVFQLFIVIAWPWVIGVNLYKLLPADLKDMKIQTFKIVIPIYFLVIIIVEILFTMNNAHSIFHPIGYFFLYGLVIFVAHIYFASFIAKELKSIELQRIAAWDDFREAFFLLFFAPIGIWWIQPRINKIFKETNDSA